MRRYIIWLAALLSLSGAAAAEDPAEYCEMSLDAAPPQAPHFEAYAVPAEHIAKPAPVDLGKDRDARRFRTTLRDGAAEGPNFAGHYTVTSWGCGSACLQWAIIDAKTGKIFFDKRNWVLDLNHVAFGGDDAAPQLPEGTTDLVGLRFRRDSRLLILIGAPGEDASREGIRYLTWNGKALEELNFYPMSLIQKCRKAE
jgi:hypothetical protein